MDSCKLGSLEIVMDKISSLSPPLPPRTKLFLRNNFCGNPVAVTVFPAVSLDGEKSWTVILGTWLMSR